MLTSVTLYNRCALLCYYYAIIMLLLFYYYAIDKTLYLYRHKNSALTYINYLTHLLHFS